MAVGRLRTASVAVTDDDATGDGSLRDRDSQPAADAHAIERIELDLVERDRRMRTGDGA